MKRVLQVLFILLFLGLVLAGFASIVLMMLGQWAR